MAVERPTSEIIMQQHVIRPSRRLSDLELERFGREHPGCKVELETDGSLLVSPTSTVDGPKNFELTGQMYALVRRAGGKGFDSGTGFRLPDGAVLSPDAAWMSEAMWNRVASLKRSGYASVMPQLWIELRSPSDRVVTLRRKLARVRRCGVAFVALIDPYARTMWTAGTPPDWFALDLEAINDA